MRAMYELGKPTQTLESALGLALDTGKTNLNTLALLDKAHTERFGHPSPAKARISEVEGKAILISGHDLTDLEALLKQTEGKVRAPLFVCVIGRRRFGRSFRMSCAVDALLGFGQHERGKCSVLTHAHPSLVAQGINVYTHGEMLPAHGYPELRKYKHLAGNYGGPWQLQKVDFSMFPGPVVMTTNCIIEPAKKYKYVLLITIFLCIFVEIFGLCLRCRTCRMVGPCMRKSRMQPRYGARSRPFS